jgi:tetratricopeptide (TPR) repeat protein
MAKPVPCAVGLLPHVDVPPRRLRPDVPRDVETICLKCLEKGPLKRYSSAEALAEDLRRFLDHRPIAARRASAAERCLRWSRRNPWIAAFLIALVLGVIGSTGQALRATLAERSARDSEATDRRERDRAETEAEISQAVNAFLREDVLGQASAENQARIDRKLDPDLKVCTALDNASETIGNGFAGRPIVEAAIRLTIGEAYLDLGLFAQAQPHFERAIELRSDQLGENDPLTLIAKDRLGTLLIEDGKLTEAEPLLVPAMEGLQAAKGLTDSETLTAMQAVGALCALQEKYAEARKPLTQTLESSRAVRGPEHPKTLGVANDLAMVCLNQGQAQEAERLLNETIQGLEESVGPEHPATLTAKLNLACVYDGLKKPEPAERLLDQVLHVERRVLGSGHPSTLVTMATLAHHHVLQGKTGLAEPLLLEALNECRKALDRNHLTTDGVLANLAFVYLQKKDAKKVGQYLLESREITRSRYGLTDGGNVAVARYYFVLNDYVNAEPFVREHLAHCVRHKPDDVQRYLAECELGVCLLAPKAVPEAERALLLSHQWMSSPDHKVPADVLDRLKQCEDRVISFYQAMGDTARANSWKVRRADLDLPGDPFAKP